MGNASHGHDPDHGHGHADSLEHRRDHPQSEHQHAPGLVNSVRDILWGHTHTGPKTDAAMEHSEDGIRAVKISLVVLLATAALQSVIVAVSGSVALMADTIHNFSDALTAIPLWIAFAIGRRTSNQRYTYGYGRAEDVAGLAIVLMISLSAALAAWESFDKLIHPRPVEHVWWVVAAAVIGFVGNETVALYRIRVGRRIGSASLEADGQHARVDGLTSLAVLFGALGVMAGFPRADPIVGLVITVAILLVLRDAATEIWWRLMDAVDPALVQQLQTAARVPGVQAIDGVRVRWIGHTLHAEANLSVNGDLTVAQGHAVAEDARHAMLHAAPWLRTAVVHVDPCGHDGLDPHALTSHHEAEGQSS